MYNVHAASAHKNIYLNLFYLNKNTIVAEN